MSAVPISADRTAPSSDRLSLSVIIPCLDAEETLGEQLEALSGQSWDGPWEVIVADNGSTDASREVAERFRDRLPSLHVLDASERPGPGHAKNRAAEVATGEALLFTDADDRVGEGWLRAMGEALERLEFVAARYDAERLNPPEVVAGRTNPQADGLIPYTYPRFLPHAGGSSLGVRRALHRAVGGYDEDLPALEDTDYCWRIQLAGTELVFVPEAVVHIRYRAGTWALARQSYRFGIYNVLMCRRYRDRGMGRLPALGGVARWVKLVLTVYEVLLPGRRAAWLAQLGWRLGRVRGCLRYRIWAL